jgi:hypothetical protein
MTDLYQRNNLFSVDGLVAVITGGGSGIPFNLNLNHHDQTNNLQVLA